jgi:hypothetical protein
MGVTLENGTEMSVATNICCVTSKNSGEAIQNMLYTEFMPMHTTHLRGDYINDHF